MRRVYGARGTTRSISATIVRGLRALTNSFGQLGSFAAASAQVGACWSSHEILCVCPEQPFNGRNSRSGTGEALLMNSTPRLATTPPDLPICSSANPAIWGVNMTDAHESTSPQRAAEVLAQRWQHAWNAHDMQSAGELLAPDADFVNVGGRWLRGRSEFVDYHVRLHEMQMRNSTWSNLALTVRELSADVALAHLEWRIEGDRDPDGRSREPRRGVFTWVLAMDGNAGLIAAAHNTNRTPATTPTNPAPAQAR